MGQIIRFTNKITSRGDAIKQKVQTLEIEYDSQVWQNKIIQYDWASIKQLSLYCLNITDIQISLVTKSQWTKLQKFDLRLNQLTGKGVQQLMKINWPSLNEIYFYENSVGDEGILQITKKAPTKLKKLKKLCVGANLLKKNGLDLFPKNESVCKNLTFLNISYSQFGPYGAKLLTKVDLSKLQIFFISCCRLGAQGIMHLTKLQCPLLEKLFIDENLLMLDGCQNVALKGNWPRLQDLYLNFHETQVSSPIQVLSYATSRGTIKFNLQNKQFSYQLQKILPFVETTNL